MVCVSACIFRAALHAANLPSYYVPLAACTCSSYVRTVRCMNCIASLHVRRSPRLARRCAAPAPAPVHASAPLTHCTWQLLASAPHSLTYVHVHGSRDRHWSQTQGQGHLLVGFYFLATQTVLDKKKVNR
jgi:hypothetical protein